MFDALFLVILSITIPIITLVGYKICGEGNSQRFTIIISIILLILEILRFFCNATFYTDAETPSENVKFNFMTVLCVVALFATFNKGKFGMFMKGVAILSVFAPMILGIFTPLTYINELDINGVCKAFYMLESGFFMSLGIMYLVQKNFKISAWYILYASLFAVAYMGVQAFIIWYWNINIPFDLIFFMSYACVVISIALVYGAIAIVNLIKHKREKRILE